MPINSRFEEDQIDEEQHEGMFNKWIRELLACVLSGPKGCQRFRKQMEDAKTKTHADFEPDIIL